jgi:hypothetical protein
VTTTAVPLTAAEPVWFTEVRAAVVQRVEEAREAWRARGTDTGPHDAIDDILNTPRNIRDTCAATDFGRSPMTELAEAFGLGDYETQWVALLAACHTDPRLLQVLGYLDDDPRPREPSPAVAAALWGWPLGYQPPAASPLIRWQLAAPTGPDRWSPTTGWAIEPDIAGYLCGHPQWSTFWPGVEHRAAETTGCLYPDLLAELASLMSATAPTRSRPWEVELLGAPGSGRRTLAAQLTDTLGRAAVVLDAGLGVRGLRTARLLDAIPIWAADGADHPIDLDERPGALTIVIRERPGPAASAGAARLSRTLPPLTRSDRCRLWAAHTPATPPAQVVDWELTPQDISVAASAVDAGPRVVASVLRGRLRRTSATAMSALDCPYDWADLIISEHVEAALRRLQNQVRLAGPVLDDWGFARLCPQSRGVTALFAGPSGTGKTMAAQVLARSLDLDLFRVDLAEVVNKYIGETEKRLAEVFAECERSHVMVFFDEADALFGRRTQVRDAHDRFANIEIDYLLQRMDTFRGVAVLATNRKNDLDTAFVRRLKVIVDFTAPSVGERRRLWQLAVPAATGAGVPVSTGIDYDWLAAELDFTGAEIKSVALDAAFCAHQAGQLIDGGHLLAAARRELAKRGSVLRAEPPPARPAVGVAR